MGLRDPVLFGARALAGTGLFFGAAFAQSYSAPAGVRPAVRHDGASILPGGRVIAPLPSEYPTGAGAFGLAVSESGRFVLTSNTGPGRNSLTLLERRGSGGWDVRQIVPPSREGRTEPEAEED